MLWSWGLSRQLLTDLGRAACCAPVQLVAQPAADAAVRQAASVSFKNLVKYRWVGVQGLSGRGKPACSAAS